MDSNTPMRRDCPEAVAARYALLDAAQWYQLMRSSFVRLNEPDQYQRDVMANAEESLVLAAIAFTRVADAITASRVGPKRSERTVESEPLALVAGRTAK